MSEDASGRGKGEDNLPQLDEKVPMPLCFAVMPISTPKGVLERYGNDPSHFVRVARHIFKPAAETAGFEFRAPASTSAEIIQAEIIENLETADLVLCDISTWNANVFFELGIRVALDRPVAMVRDHLTEAIPFDNSMINTYTYDCRLEIFRVEEEVPKLATFLEGVKGQTQNALWKYFGITQRAARTDPDNPEDAKLDLLLKEVQALRSDSDRSHSNSSELPIRRVLRTIPAPKVYVGGRFRLSRSAQAAVAEIVQSLPEGRVDGWDYRDRELTIQLSIDDLMPDEENLIRSIAQRHGVELSRIYSGDP